MYDSLMEKNIFPKKFNADIKKHEEILENLYSSIQDCSVLELACGSGNLSNLLTRNNQYSGVDISPGLIRIALKKFRAAGFDHPEFYISDAVHLPFIDDIFDICICNLSLNFFPDTAAAADEIGRILKKEVQFTAVILFLKGNLKKALSGEHFLLPLNLKLFLLTQDSVLQNTILRTEQFFILKQ